MQNCPNKSYPAVALFPRNRPESDQLGRDHSSAAWGSAVLCETTESSLWMAFDVVRMDICDGHQLSENPVRPHNSRIKIIFYFRAAACLLCGFSESKELAVLVGKAGR